MPLPAKTYKKWYRYDAQGNKQIKCFPANIQPEPKKEECYSEWLEGTGPHHPDHLLKIQHAVRSALKGIPKSPQQKLKMSLAQKGIPKTEEHKQNMRKAKQKLIPNE